MITDVFYVRGEELEGLEPILMSVPAHELGSAERGSSNECRPLNTLFGESGSSDRKGKKQKKDRPSTSNEKTPLPPILLPTFRPKISIADSESVEPDSLEHRCPTSLCLCNESGPPDTDEEYYRRREEHRKLTSEVSKMRVGYEAGKTASLNRNQILKYMGNVESINAETLRKYILGALLRLAPTGNPLQSSMTTSSIRLSLAFYQALASRINQWTEDTDVS